MITTRDEQQSLSGIEVHDSVNSDDPQALVRLQVKQKITEAAASERYRTVWNRAYSRSSLYKFLHLLFPSLGR